MGSQTFLSQGTFLFDKKISFDFLDDPKKIKCLNYMYIFVRKLATWIDRTLLRGGRDCLQKARLNLKDNPATK